MSLENASGGFTDLDELARDSTLVVTRIKKIHPEEVSSEGYKSLPVTADLLICSGQRSGEVVRGMKIRKGGITNTLRRSSVGKDVAGVIVVKKIDKRKDPFPAMDPCSGSQLEDVKATYRDGVGFDGNENLVAASAAPAATASAGETRPPF